MTNPITTLHNYLQGQGQLHLLSWVEVPSGPSHEQVWTIHCKIDGEIKGTGTGMQKAVAKEAAAQRAYEAIKLT